MLLVNSVGSGRWLPDVVRGCEWIFGTEAPFAVPRSAGVTRPRLSNRETTTNPGWTSRRRLSRHLQTVAVTTTNTTLPGPWGGAQRADRRPVAALNNGWLGAGRTPQRPLTCQFRSDPEGSTKWSLFPPVASLLGCDRVCKRGVGVLWEGYDWRFGQQWPRRSAHRGARSAEVWASVAGGVPCVGCEADHRVVVRREPGVTAWRRTVWPFSCSVRGALDDR